MILPYKEKNMALTACILEHEVFNRCFKVYLNHGKLPSIESIVEIMLDSYIYNVSSMRTYKRRAQTVRKWLEWIINLTQKKIKS